MFGGIFPNRTDSSPTEGNEWPENEQQHPLEMETSKRRSMKGTWLRYLEDLEHQGGGADQDIATQEKTSQTQSLPSFILL